jgi:hypothetical protein
MLTAEAGGECWWFDAVVEQSSSAKPCAIIAKLRETIGPPRTVSKSQTDTGWIKPNRRVFMIIEAWDTGAYRDVREIWERAELLAGEDKFKTELIRGLNALTGHLEYDIGQIKAALSALSALSELIDSAQPKKRK